MRRYVHFNCCIVFLPIQCMLSICSEYGHGTMNYFWHWLNKLERWSSGLFLTYGNLVSGLLKYRQCTYILIIGGEDFLKVKFHFGMSKLVTKISLIGTGVYVPWQFSESFLWTWKRSSLEYQVQVKQPVATKSTHRTELNVKHSKQGWRK